MADALPSTGNAIGERRKEGDTTFEWDGVAWFRVKENQDNTFADDVDYTLSVSGNSNPTIALTSSEGDTSAVNVRGIGDATVGSDQFGIFINTTAGDQAAIIDTNGTPSLASGVTGAEIRTLIGTTDTDTTYDLGAAAGTVGVDVSLTPSSGTADTVNIRAGNHATVELSDGNIVVSGSDPASAAGALVAERMALLAGVGSWTIVTGVTPALPAGVTLRAIGSGSENEYYCRVTSAGVLQAYTDRNLTTLYGEHEYARASS